MKPWLLLPALTLLSCQAAPADGADTLGSSDTSGDPSDSGPGDSGPDTTPDTAPVQDLTSQLHPTIESLVYVRWEQLEPASAWVEYSFDAGEWLSAPASQAGVGAQELLLLGIPYDSDFRWRVVNDRGAGLEYSPDQSAKTGPLPEGLPLPTVLVSDPSAWAEGDTYLYSSINQSTGGWTGGDYWQFIMDRQGRIVWALLTPDQHWTIYVRTSANGEDLLWDDATYWVNYSGDDSRVHRMKIDGTIVATYDTPGLHHAFTELPDETLVWGAINGSSETLESLKPDGSRERIWDCATFHAENDIDRSCQSNSLFWDEPTDSFLYSFYTTSTLVQIDRATGATLRFWGDESDWNFDPEDSAFDWQHGATFTEGGTLLLSTHASHTTSSCATREYQLSDTDTSLTQLWSYEDELKCSTAGESHRLSNGDTLHNLGAGARTREITPDGRLVWDVEWPDGQDYGRLQGRSIFLDDLYAFAP